MLLILAFAFLGFTDFSEPKPVNIRRCYGVLVAIAVEQVLWQLATGRRTHLLLGPAGAAIVLLFVGLIGGEAYPWLNWYVVIGLGVVVASYLVSTHGGRT